MPSGTAKSRKRPNVSEDTLREIKRLLTGDATDSFKPATFGESLKYNFLGVTPQKEEKAGGFGKALMAEAQSQFRGLFGIKTTKKEREEEAAMMAAEAERKEAEAKKKEAQEAKERKMREDEVKAAKGSAKNIFVVATTLRAVLSEVNTIRRVVEGSMKREKGGRYRDADTGRYTTATSGIDVPTAAEIDSGDELVAAKLEELSENQQAGTDIDVNLGGGPGSIFPRLFPQKPITTGPTVKPGATTARNAGAKILGREVAEQGSKTALKSVLKKVPVVGLLAGGAFAAGRAMRGDLTGAGMELASGTASMMPGAGTAASLGIDAALMARDMSRTASLESGSQAATQPVTVNNVDASTNPVIAPQSGTPAGTQSTISLRDTHGSHLRFQENRLTRPM
jgi:hypothetical protein